MPRQSAAVHYAVEILSAPAHLFRVTLNVVPQTAEPLALSLPVWIPGSYMVREFAKNIVEISATQGGRSLSLRKQDKQRWLTARPKAGEALRVEYTVYAWDLSVRCAHLDQTHAFFNGTQMFLQVEGQEGLPHFVDLRRPRGAGFAAWKVATTLPTARGARGAARRGEFGLYRAPDYDTLVDHPVEMGTYQSVSFKAGGVPHEMAVTGRVRFDAKRLADDLSRICQWQIDFFGGEAPFPRYLFMTMAVGDGYGGLEHRDSTALLCSRNDLPAKDTAMGDAYRGFLGLCSHEYFHSWNVKRIQPAAFRPYRLDEENYTRLLWVFEGFTSYYDDIALVRSGVIAPTDYLTLLAKTIAMVERGAGRKKQTVAESSFDTWIKYYRQDENSPNAIVSYYTKGSLIAAGLDLTIRSETRGRRSLDDVMRHLWNDYALAGRGVGEDEMPAIIEAATGVDVRRQLALWVDSSLDVPLDALLKPFGVSLARRTGLLSSGLGVKTRAEGGGLKLTHVLDGGAAQLAGLSAGDELVALDGLRVTGNNLDVLLTRYQAGDDVALTAFRRDELMSFNLKLMAPRVESCELRLEDKVPAATRRLREGWLAG